VRALQMTDWKTTPQFVEVPDPEPGPGQVVVKIGGAGACHSDLHIIHEFDEGMMPWAPPFTLGHENAGWVESMGRGVEGLELGQPVAVYGPWGCGWCRQCLIGAENYCEHASERPGGVGIGVDGGMADYLLIPNPRRLVPIGDLDPAEAAPLTDAALTPYHAIKRSLPRLLAGSHAVVIGVGGLGHVAIQILSALSPATVIAVDSRAAALEMARSLGAGDAVLSGPDAAAGVMAATMGAGADAIFDFVGSSETIALGASVARPLSDLTIVGVAGGEFTFSFFSIPYELNIATVLWGTLPELYEVVALAKRGLVRTRVQRFALEEALHAYELMEKGELAGRAVMVP
jgi:alcohol dehydrogenase, propanol-preferring